MNSLEHLGLYDNALKNVYSAVFSGLVNLKRVDLRGNKLQDLHPDTFLGLPNLQQLYLYYNPTLQIPTDCPFINSLSLTHLGISGCSVNLNICKCQCTEMA
jgi:Leucine-rich repeat (LRR) protein